jgi:23S rRNA (adenine1618-N6)-methyltransferase
MSSPKKEHPKLKYELHPRNKHRERYDFKQLILTSPELTPFVKLNVYDDESIDFFDAQAVKMLNKALIKHYYHIQYWDIPANYLCPPIPGRADYIHNMADLLAFKNKEKIPQGTKIKCLDIGVGANCIYPIIGNRVYGWNYVGTDIDKAAISSANKIVDLNPTLKGNIEIRFQQNSRNIFQDIIQINERFDVTVCNPPFHSSLAEAQRGSLRKLNNLKGKKNTKVVLNFGGQNAELWCQGGEVQFVKNMIFESKRFYNSCFYFTTLISKQVNLKYVYETLHQVEVAEIKIMGMGQGNKTSRIVAWTFLNKEQQEKWIKERWK